MSKAGPFVLLGGFLSRRFSARTGHGIRSGGEQVTPDPRLAVDTPEAIDAIRTAAEQGDAAAQNRLGIRFAFGQGVLRNDVEARVWLTRAASQGLAEAQFNLGNLCHSMSLQHRPATDREARVEAYTWFHIAAAQGHTQAAASCETLNLQLTDTELDLGTRRANAFKPNAEPAPAPGP